MHPVSEAEGHHAATLEGFHSERLTYSQGVVSRRVGEAVTCGYLRCPATSLKCSSGAGSQSRSVPEDVVHPLGNRSTRGRPSKRTTALAA